MTEQEQKAIKWMQNVRDDAIVTLDNIAKEEPNVSPMLYAGRKEKEETLIKGFEELEQYREIGSVEKIKEELERLRNDNDCQGLYFTLEERQDLARQHRELEEYRTIGTPEECRAAVEKQKAKKPKEYEDKFYGCPTCGNVLLHKWEKYNTKLMDKKNGLPYCLGCGQKLDWSDEE